MKKTKSTPRATPRRCAVSTEANQLACLLDARQFKDLNYRVEIAVRSEMERLRGIATELRRNIPDGIDEPNTDSATKR